MNKRSVHEAVDTWLWLAAGIVVAILVFLAVPDSDESYYQWPRLWPAMAAIIMLLAGLSVVVAKCMKRSAPDVDTSDPEDVRQRWSHVWIVISIIAYIMSVAWAGYIIATFALLTLIMRSMGSRSWLINGATSAAVSLITAYFFGALLSVALPRGVGLLSDMSRFIY